METLRVVGYLALGGLAPVMVLIVGMLSGLTRRSHGRAVRGCADVDANAAREGVVEYVAGSPDA